MLDFIEFPNRIPSSDIFEEPKLVGFSAESFAMDLNESDSDRDLTVDDLMVCHAGVTPSPRKQLIESFTAFEEEEPPTTRSPRPSEPEPEPSE